jgi:hypothetical protein
MNLESARKARVEVKFELQSPKGRTSEFEAETAMIAEQTKPEGLGNGLV